MATLYVENVPDELYEALRKQAKEERRSIAAEVISLLEQNVPTPKVLRQRKEFVKWVERRHESQRSADRRFPTTEEMIREDRER